MTHANKNIVNSGKIKITKSNSLFLKTGDFTEVIHNPDDGDDYIWIRKLLKHEKLSWCRQVWGIEFECV